MAGMAAMARNLQDRPMNSQPHPDAGPAMKLHQMRYLVAVAGCGSVRAASRALGITQSAITQALRELEEGHRLALFELSLIHI